MPKMLYFETNRRNGSTVKIKKHLKHLLQPNSANKYNTNPRQKYLNSLHLEMKVIGVGLLFSGGSKWSQKSWLGPPTTFY